MSATLHLLASSPYRDQRLTSCLRLLAADDSLLLSGDALYALQPGNPLAARLAALGPGRCHVLREDLEARNLDLPAGITAVDYDGFVALTLSHARVNSWL